MWVERSPPAAIPEAHGGVARAAPLFVVINPGSGATDAAQTRQLLARVFEEAGRTASFADVEAPAMLVQAFDRSAAQASKEGGILVAVGGDGTLNSAAHAALLHGCPLGVIPQGTFNLLARDRGIPADPEAAARALLRASATPMQLGVVNGQLFHLNASLGLYPQLLQDRESFSAQFGRKPWVAVISGLITLFKWRRQMLLEIETDGERTILRTPTLFVANNRLQLERIGIEDEVAEGLSRGRLAGIVVKPIGTLAMLVLVLRGALGGLGEADQVRSFCFQRLDVKVRGSRRVKISTDGEIRVLTPPLRFSLAPQPLMLMIPAAQDRAPRE